MGAKLSVLGLIMSFPPYLRSAMVRFPLANKIQIGLEEVTSITKTSIVCSTQPIRLFLVLK